MNKPITLCSRCDIAASCLLNYDGVPCRKNRTVEPTNYDRIISKSPEELAKWIAGDVLNLLGGAMDLSARSWLDWLKQEEKE